eukprot:scaffold164042_cov43-Prasinocladus_malaysianus.AAC.1
MAYECPPLHIQCDTALIVYVPADPTQCSVFENELTAELLEGKRIVELGCGCGLLGLALAIISKGKSEVILTDYDDGALEMA